MKIAFLIGDGMGDYPVDSLGGKTPLQAADIPHTRRIAAAGSVQMVRTAPAGMFPGSDVCNLALLGYDPSENYTGRAPIEAAGAGFHLAPEDVAYRCNLVTVTGGIMRDHSAGHITDPEAAQLIDALKPVVERPGIRLHRGVGYRHLLLWRDGPAEVRTEMPHEILGRSTTDSLPSGPRSEEVRAVMDAASTVLAAHPVNRERREAGKNLATQIWLWGQGRRLTVEPFLDRYGLTGGMITAVDLLRGLARLSGLDVIDVEGATGFVDTNYEGKAQAATEVLERHDFVYVHLEAPDECGHQGDALLKTRAITDFDHRIVAPVWSYLEQRQEPYLLVVTTDHRTPVKLRGHSDEAIPFAVLHGPVGPVQEEAPFDEFVPTDGPPEIAHRIVRDLLLSAAG